MGRVNCNFVVGPETAPRDEFRTPEEGAESWRQCFASLLSEGVIPSTSQWQVEVNSRWEEKKPPPTEYFLSVAQALHRQMESCGVYDYMMHYYYKAMAWSTDGDFRRLLHGCSCNKCQ